MRRISLSVALVVEQRGRHLVNRQLMVDKAAGIFRKKGDSCRIGESTLCVVWRDRHSSNE